MKQNKKTSQTCRNGTQRNISNEYIYIYLKIYILYNDHNHDHVEDDDDYE